MPSRPTTVAQAVRHISRRWRLPFSLFLVYAEGGVIHAQVQVDQVDVARAYFAQHEIVLSNGQVVPITITGAWVERRESWPLRPPTERQQMPDGLVGMDVDDAARLANAAGFVVRATQPDGVLDTAHQPSRVTLIYDEHDRVVECWHG